jgi:long-chain acyl-CoA synthetase
MTIDENTQNLNQAILAAMDAHAEKSCFRIKEGERFQNISYQNFEALTFHTIRYLQQQGITNGERVAIAMSNCLEWMVLYVATLLSGGVVVPLHPSIAPDTLRFTLQDSEAQIVVLDSPDLLQTVASLINSPDNQLPDLQTVLVNSQIKAESDAVASIASIASILTETVPLTQQECKAICNYAVRTAPETLLSIHYTAGETGRLKGAVFDHDRVVKTMQHLAQAVPLEEDDLAFTVLPWSHASSLQIALHYFLVGVTNVLSKGTDQVTTEDMQQTSPTITLNMPYFYERFYQYVMDDFWQEPESTRKVFQWAIAKGKEHHAAGSEVSPELRQEYARADMTFFNRIRGYIGGRMRRLYSAGDPLPPKLTEFFEAIGLPILNLYSITEAGGFPFISEPDNHRSGSLGRTAPGFESRIADDGELLIRSETTMCEYWGWPADMQQVFDAEGWLHTGDIGYFDDDGYLYPTARKQPLMQLTTGRRIMPSAIEAALMSSPFIDQAVVFGEGRPYISALIIPNLEALVAHFQEDEESGDQSDSARGQADKSIRWLWKHESDEPRLRRSTAHPKVQALLDKAIAKVNNQLDRWEQIREYTLLEQARSETAEELVATMVQGRHVVAEQYAADIDLMYPQPVPVSQSTVTEVKVPPERLRELLEKESILDAWLADAGIGFLFELARTKHIDAPSMVHISDAAATIAQMEHEEKPISTALIVGDPVRIGRTLPESQIRLFRHDHIRRMRRMLVTLAEMVDGLVLGFVVDRHGYVRGIHKLNVTLAKQPVSFLFGPQFRRHAVISHQCEAVVFFVPSGGRQVLVFADGQLAGRYSNGDWSPESASRVDEIIAPLVKQKGCELALVKRILRCAFRMSEENMGAIFIIGNADTILQYSDAPQISHFALIASDNVDNLTDLELINFAKQDGATVIDAQGQFRGCMVLLRPDASTKAEIGAGKGARHSSAAKMSAEAECLAITVSQDGPITIYSDGKRVLSL